MLKAVAKENYLHSLGNEPMHVLGFETEKDLETALGPLMEEITTEDLMVA